MTFRFEPFVYVICILKFFFCKWNCDVIFYYLITIIKICADIFSFIVDKFCIINQLFYYVQKVLFLGCSTIDYRSVVMHNHSNPRSIHKNCVFNPLCITLHHIFTPKFICKKNVWQLWIMMHMR